MNGHADAFGDNRVRFGGGVAHREDTVICQSESYVGRTTIARWLEKFQRIAALDFAGKINEAPVGLYYARYQEEGTGAKKLIFPASGPG